MSKQLHKNFTDEQIIIKNLCGPQSQAKFQSKSRTFFHSWKTKKLIIKYIKLLGINL